MHVSMCRSGRFSLGTVDLWGWIILWDEAALVCPLMSGSIPGLYLLVVTSIAPVMTPRQRHQTLPDIPGEAKPPLAQDPRCWVWNSVPRAGRLSCSVT